MEMSAGGRFGCPHACAGAEEHKGDATTMTMPETLMPRPFRFGIVAGSAPDGAAHGAARGAAWKELARKAESLGFGSLLLPDAPGQAPAPFPTLAWVAAVTTTLHIGTYVLSNDLHHPLHVARDAATLDELSGGRFELGLGAGRPGSEAGHGAYGLSWDAPGVRFERLQASVGIITELFAGRTVSRSGPFYQMDDAQLQISLPDGRRPPLLIAGSGDRMLRLAASVADIVVFGGDPAATLDDVKTRMSIVHQTAAAHQRAPELTINLAGAGDVIHPWLRQRLEPRRDELVAAGAPSLLMGDAGQMVEQLHRLREVLGVTYFTAPEGLIDQLAPVIRAVA